MEDELHHLRGERALAGDVAQLLQFLGEVTVQGDPPLQFSPGGIGGEQGAVALCQFRAAVFFHCRFHTANILKISELRKFLLTEIHIIIIIYRTLIDVVSDFNSQGIGVYFDANRSLINSTQRHKEFYKR